MDENAEVAEEEESMVEINSDLAELARLFEEEEEEERKLMEKEMGKKKNIEFAENKEEENPELAELVRLIEKEEEEKIHKEKGNRKKGGKENIDFVENKDEENLLAEIQKHSDDSGEEDREVDEKRHKKLLKSIGVEQKREGDEKQSKEQRSEAATDVSIYSLVGAKGSKSKLKPHQLVEGIKDTVKVNVLKKNLTKIEKSKKHLKAPLPRITAEKSERDAAYENTSEKISRWDDIVKRNRRAEQLSFPLNQENLQVHTVDDYVKRFKPKTPLEKEIYALLKGNKYEERDESGLSVAEAEALLSVSIEEAKQRRSELQKYRALLSYHEAKNRRLGKIKSRRHLRIIRKQKEKKLNEDFEELQRRDPEAAAAKIKQAEKMRAEERAVLRHRQGSKWAKNRALMAKYDETTKVQLEEQRKHHKELMKKKLMQMYSSDEEEDINNNVNNVDKTDVSKLVPPTATQQTLYLPQNNPWLRHGHVKEEKAAQDEDEQNHSEDEDKKPSGSRSRAVLGLEAVTRQKDEETDESTDDESDLKNELDEIRTRKKFREEMEENPESEEESEELQRDENVTKSIESFKSAFASLQREERKMRKGKGRKEGKEMPKTVETDSDGDSIHVDELEDENENLDNKDISIDKGQEFVGRSEKGGKYGKESKELEYIDPGKVFTLPTKNVTSQIPKVIDDEDENDSDAECDSNIMTIQEAFADDDVLGDFVAEKRKNVDNSKPKRQDLTLPGWGEWGGVGMKPPKRKRKRFQVKPNPPPPRKDQHLGPVIINEKRDVHISKHQVNQVPFPYTSVEQFERSFRQPVGQTWNTPSTFKKLTEPTVKTLAGAIINPMDEEEAFDDAKPKSRKRGFRGEGGQGGDEEKTHKKRNKKKGNKKHKK